MTTLAQKQVETSMGEAMNLRLASPFHLHGVGPAYTWKLALSGIQTIQELLDYHDLNKLSESSSIPFKVLRMIRLKARSIVNDEIIQIAPFWMPRKEPIYLDIETVPKWDKVWLIGLLIDDDFIQLYATDYDEEGSILSKFNEMISQYRDRFLVIWTGFDTRILRKRMEVHGLPLFYMNVLGHVDLKLKMRRCFIFPTRGYGLKRVGKFLRYPFKNPHLDGLAVSSQYQGHIERDEDLSPEVFEYNEDDVSALPYIESWAIMHQSQTSCVSF
jgi:predicted RecB family nuclease